jgi:SNF2 family DNA or RNA helicase
MATRPSLKPMKHQVKSLAHDAKNRVVYDTSEPGTGKTAVRIWGFERRHKRNGKAMLVLAPRSLLKAVWEKDFRKFAPGLRVSVAFAANKQQAFAADADVYVTNHDQVKWLAQQKPSFFKRFGELVVDEITAYKHHNSQRSKAVKKICKHFEQRKGLTGTPNTVSITDVWHQMLILDDGKRLGNQFFAFRASVQDAEPVPRVANAYNWTDKEGSEEAVFGLLSDVVVRHMLDDCADIPKNHHHQIEYTLPPKQQRVFDDMARSSLLLLPGAKITAVNAAAVATKLLQIGSGAVYTQHGEYSVIDEDRYSLVMDLAEARKQPLIFFLWKHQRDMLVKQIKARHLNYAIIDGDSSDQDRADAESMYQRGLLDGIAAHPKTMAHGFTLTAGTSTIWASPTQNLEWYDQGSRRQRRIGQTEKTETITVLADNDVERAVYADLLAKDARMSNFLGLFHMNTVEA